MTLAAPWDQHWMQRWEAQQGRMRHRKARFEVITEAVRAHCPDPPKVIDLGCGPGSLGLQIVRSIPDANVVGVDADPVVLELGRNALRDEPGISFVDANLGEPSLAQLGHDFDAAVSTTALHWLELPALRQLYSSLATMLKPGAILLNGDWLPGTGEQTIDSLLLEMRGPVAGEPSPEDGETWDELWYALQEEPALKAAFEERERRQYDHPDDDDIPTFADHKSALLDAGFTEVGTLWQYLNSRVLIAVR